MKSKMASKITQVASKTIKFHRFCKAFVSITFLKKITPGRALWEGAPSMGRAGAVEGVRGRHKSLPLGVWIGLGFVIVLDLHALRPRKLVALADLTKTTNNHEFYSCVIETVFQTSFGAF